MNVIPVLLQDTEALSSWGASFLKDGWITELSCVTPPQSHKGPVESKCILKDYFNRSWNLNSPIQDWKQSFPYLILEKYFSAEKKKSALGDQKCFCLVIQEHSQHCRLETWRRSAVLSKTLTLSTFDPFGFICLE